MFKVDMRTTIAICLFALLTSTQTPLGQLLKLPVLMKHFYTHRNQDNVSLLEFLASHYTSEHNDADRAEDEKLPFKSIILLSVEPAIVPDSTDFSLSFAVPAKVMMQDTYTPQQHLYCIFHPPRV